jgi:hypothetical protein
VNDRDAFGRKTGEDPLAQMGWSEESATAAESTASAERSMPAERVERKMLGGATPDAAGRSTRVIRPARAIGCLVPLIFVAAVVVIAAVFLVPVVQDAAESVDDATSPLPMEVEEPPRGLARGSMLLRGNLAPALATMRREMGGELRYVRIEAERVDLQVVADGRLVSAQARWDDEPRVSGGSGSASGDTFSWTVVDASAPRRIVERVTRRAGRPSSAFQYAVLIDAAGLRWSVFLRDGTHYNASPDGRTVERV